MNVLAGFGRFGLFLAAFTKATATHPPPVQRSIEEAYAVGIKALPILLITTTFIGTNLSLQGYAAFKPLGGEQMVGMFVALAGLRELVPIMVASMVAAKSGTEMASQIAVMRIQEEIDALEVMAINPYWFLITPRLFGILIALPALNVIATFTLFVSAWAVAVVQLGLNGPHFLQLAAETSRPEDFLYGAIKSLVFALIICFVSCYQGFHSEKGPDGVGRATNAAVVVAAVSASIANYFLSEMLYG